MQTLQSWDIHLVLSKVTIKKIHNYPLWNITISEKVHLLVASVCQAKEGIVLYLPISEQHARVFIGIYQTHKINTHTMPASSACHECARTVLLLERPARDSLGVLFNSL